MVQSSAERDQANRRRIDFYRAQFGARSDSVSKAKVRDLDALLRAIRETPELCLFMLDVQADRVRAAVAHGDPLTADYVGVTVGGLNTNVFDAVGGMNREAKELRKEALGLLKAEGVVGGVATVGWLGYRAPQTDYGTRVDALFGVIDVMRRKCARRGAPALADFYRELRAARSDRRITAVGHSYGSLATSYALRELTPGTVDAVVFYGSPGLDLRCARKRTAELLNMGDGTVFAMRGAADWVRYVAGTGFPGDPLDMAWVTPLGTRSMVGPGDGLAHGPALNHADYPRNGSNGRISIAGHNVASIIIGRPDLATRPGRKGERPQSL